MPSCSRCMPEVPVGGVERPLDQPRLERLASFVEGDAALEHLGHEPIEEVAEAVGAHSRSRPVSRRKASRYFSRVRRTTSSGNVGTGGCLFQRIASR